jgi:hypothetical protein
MIAERVAQKWGPLYTRYAVDSRRRLTGQLLWFLLWFGTTGFAAFLSPDPHLHGTHQQLGLPPCPSVIFFHRPCPGCGLTTSFTAFVHGHWAQAFQAHAFGPALYALFTISALTCGWHWLRRVRFDTDTKLFNYALGTLVGVFLAYGAIRFSLTQNYQPFAPFRPTNSVSR